MVAHITGNAQPIYGSVKHGEAMQQMLRIFPDMHVQTPVSGPIGQWRLDHRRFTRHRDVHRRDGSPNGKVDRSDGKKVRRGSRSNHKVGWRPAHHHLGLLGRALQAKQLGLG